jgi:hypothetical protein
MMKQGLSAARCFYIIREEWRLLLYASLPGRQPPTEDKLALMKNSQLCAATNSQRLAEYFR